jgi:hydroxyacylglutathione hydrolase
MVRFQIDHRKSREAQIRTTLESHSQATPTELAQKIYTNVDQLLVPAAARNVLAHLIDLAERNIVASDRPISPEARFTLK